MPTPETLAPYTEPARLGILPLLSKLFSDYDKQEALTRGLALVSRLSDRALDEDQYLLYVDILDDLTAMQICRGLSLASRLDSFFPSPARIRELSGAPSEADLARDALAWLIGYLRKFGVDGKEKPAVFKDAMGEDHRVRPMQVRPPEPAPLIPELLQRTLALLGSGDARNGLQMLCTHPGLSSWDPSQGMEPVWVSEKLEAKFQIAFNRARLGHGSAAAGNLRKMRASAGS